MKSGDPEATEGLERAKAAMLKARSNEAAKGEPAERPAPAPKPARAQEPEEETIPGTPAQVAEAIAESVAPEESDEGANGVTDPAPAPGAALAEAPAEPRVLEEREDGSGEPADEDDAALDGRHPPASEVRVPPSPEGRASPGSGTRANFPAGAQKAAPVRRAGGAPGAAPAAELHDDEEPALDVDDDELFEDNPR